MKLLNLTTPRLYLTTELWETWDRERVEQLLLYCTSFSKCDILDDAFRPLSRSTIYDTIRYDVTHILNDRSRPADKRSKGWIRRGI
jgi:hypothetical protein